MNAETIAKALGGRKAGGGWLARCPAHEDRNPSLAIHDADDGKVLVCCHAGCDQGRVIGFLRSRGLWDENSHREFTRPTPRSVANNRPDRDDAKRSGRRSPSGAPRRRQAARWSRPISSFAACIFHRRRR